MPRKIARPIDGVSIEVEGVVVASWGGVQSRAIGLPLYVANSHTGQGWERFHHTWTGREGRSGPRRVAFRSVRSLQPLKYRWHRQDCLPKSPVLAVPRVEDAQSSS